MLVLAFDTATPAVTVAVGNAERVLAQQTTVDARRQGELLATSIGKVLADAGVTAGDLDAVVAGAGPGPYTGLRVGLVTARVLGSALGISAYGICTLDVIAADAVPAAAGREFLVATDARRREVYWARYSPDGRRLSGPGVAAPATLPAGLPAAGEGAQLSTKACSATRSRRAIPPPPPPSFFVPNGWRSVTTSRRPSRCTCAGQMPGFPAHPRACCRTRPRPAPPAPAWCRRERGLAADGAGRRRGGRGPRASPVRRGGVVPGPARR